MAVAAALGLAVAVAITPVHSASAALDPTSRAAVTAAYLTQYVPAAKTPTGWTGSTQSCSVGSESSASQNATVTAINYVRQLAGLSPVTLSAANSAKALKAALVYHAQGDISHDIPTNWPCYSADAAKAGPKSNIALGYAGASSVVEAYMNDPGAGNEVAGHRRWILYPELDTVGTGSTDDTNALWISDWTAKKVKNPKWVSWPSAGYFPSQFEPDGRWSLSGNSMFDVNFAKAKVTVTDASGHRLAVKQHRWSAKTANGYGNGTLVWEVAGVKAPTGTSDVKPYSVKVTGITKTGSKKKLSYSYTVNMFDPTAG